MSRSRITFVLAFVWLLSILVSYYVIHVPIPSAMAVAIGQMLIDLLAACSVMVLAGALGRLVMGELETLPDLVRGAFWMLIGLGMVSALVLVTGLLGWLPPRWLAWLIALGLMGALWRFVWQWLQVIGRGVGEAFGAPVDDPAVRWIRRGVAALLVVTVVLALAPPTKWDAMTYHLTLPYRYIKAGRILPDPGNVLTDFPQVVEMLYLWVMIMARPQAAAVIHAGFGIMVILLVVGQGITSRKENNPVAGWLAVGILLTAESLWQAFHWPYNDHGAVAYILAALVALFIWEEREKGPRWLIWAGVFTGLAVGSKLNAAAFSVGIAVFTVWLARRDGMGGMLRAVGIVTGAAVVAFLPWVIRNLVFEGNPLGSFMLGTTPSDQLYNTFYLSPGTGLEWYQVPLAPLQATVFGVQGGSYNATIGALLFGLLPLILVGWWGRDQGERQMMVNLLVFSIVPMISWFISVGTSWFFVRTRYLYPLFPVLAVLGALGIEGLGRIASLKMGQAFLRWVTVIALGLVVFNAGILVVKQHVLAVLLGFESEEEYLLEEMQLYYRVMQEVNTLPEDSRVLFLWEPRSFYCEVDCIGDVILARWWHDRQFEPDPHQIAQQWWDDGITHVLIYESGLDLMFEAPYVLFTEEDAQAVDEIRGEELVPVWDEYDDYVLYELQVIDDSP